MGAKRGTPAERLDRRLNKGEDDCCACWLWTGSIVPTTGYGSIRVAGKSMSTHRLAWELEHGPIPDGMCVLHRCDVRACCRPDHLFLGTVGDNNADMDRKGRGKHWGGSRPGERSNSAKLTTTQVQDIRTLFSGGISQSELGRRFGVTQAQIYNIVSGKQWKEVACGA